MLLLLNYHLVNTFECNNPCFHDRIYDVLYSCQFSVVFYKIEEKEMRNFRNWLHRKTKEFHCQIVCTGLKCTILYVAKRLGSKKSIPLQYKLYPLFLFKGRLKYTIEHRF